MSDELEPRAVLRPGDRLSLDTLRAIAEKYAAGSPELRVSRTALDRLRELLPSGDGSESLYGMPLIPDRGLPEGYALLVGAPPPPGHEGEWNGMVFLRLVPPPD